EDTALAGRASVGDRTDDGGRAVVAYVPVFSADDDRPGRLVGAVAVGQEYPTPVEYLVSAVPNLITYLGLAGGLGIGGSLLLARRVKRQTLGLEPREIRGLVEHREAMLTGIKEGVLALDPDDAVTLVNAEAHRMLRLPPDCIGRPLAALDLEPRVVDVLTSRDGQRDAIVFVGERILTLNRMPVSVRGAAVGSVTTMRDLTELRALRRELGVNRQTTEGLRAQAHEFANRLHTISGLLELGEYEEVLRYVKRLGSATLELSATVTRVLDDPTLAALLIAKASVAAERGIHLQIAPSSRIGLLDDQLSEDLATVVGNLVDNALDAIGPLGGGEVVVEVVEETGDAGGRGSAGAVRVEVRDSGPGVAPELVEEVFARGFTTKAAGGGPRGFGLALTRAICVRRGGSVSVRNDDGAVFAALLPLVSTSVPAGAPSPASRSSASRSSASSSSASYSSGGGRP
ncbi:MAG: two-component system, CitB family, sensor kinase, partial [Pseudonocardiales bacterium]|nr:two-component system, CitB family, sensor kinase [Pseudonocardiales bacterium]